MGTDLGPLRGVDERRAFRAFVKANHPDAGGDPETFVSGLRHWQHAVPLPRRAPANVVFHRRRGVARLTGWWPSGRRRPRRVH